MSEMMPDLIPMAAHDAYSKRRQYNLNPLGVVSFSTTGYLNAIYGWMGIGLLITAITAFWASEQPGLHTYLFGEPVRTGMLLAAECLLAMLVSKLPHRTPALIITGMYLVFTAVAGVLLSFLFTTFSLYVLGTLFLLTAAMFGAMCLFGMITKRTLSHWGTFFIAAAFGTVIGYVVSHVWLSNSLLFFFNMLTILLFAGLTAVQVQEFKRQINVLYTRGDFLRGAIRGALALYLSFIVLFLRLLPFNGRRGA